MLVSLFFALTFRLTAHANTAEHTLHLAHEGVRAVWRVDVNGRRLGDLQVQDQPTITALAVPAGVLRNGENLIALEPSKAEEIRVGPIRVDPRPLAVSTSDARLEVSVNTPARITVVDEHGYLPQLTAESGQRLAVRPGVVYTGDGRARFRLPAGRYTVYASRGFEWGVDQKRVTLVGGGRAAVTLRLVREVPTPGLVSVDTHVHTLTFSRHGDATADERVLTLAGEGIELAVASEHNQHSGYEEAAQRMGVRDRFTPVLGNEVTTSIGHFITWPVVPGSPTPDPGLKNWPALMAAMRRTPGVQVVILNHPRDDFGGFVPFAHLEAPPTVDAVELVNSGTMRSEALDVYRDWFELLDRGHRLFGVGASDSHHVNQLIVGQGRTYAACADGHPDRIDVAEASAAFRDGRTLVSLGLLVQMTVNGRSVGELVTGSDLEVKVSVLGPSWTSVDRVRLYGNGVLLRDEPVAPTGRPGEKARMTWRLHPSQDVYLVAVATGPGVTAPFWPIPRPYKPTTNTWTPYVIGSTNPIWVDADGDGRYRRASF